MICVRESARGLMDLGVRDGLAIGNGIQTVENEQQAWRAATGRTKTKAAAQQKRHWRFWACATSGKFSGRFGVRLKTGEDRDARAAARLLAVQALYQMDIAKTPLENIIREFVAHR